MTDKLTQPAPKKPGRPKKVKANPSMEHLPYNKPKGPPQLKGQIISGRLFVGDASFFGDDPQKYADGIIPDDPANPFKDWNKFSSLQEDDTVLDLPFFGPPGRGVVIQTHLQSGSYSVDKEIDETTGKLLSIKVTFRE